MKNEFNLQIENYSANGRWQYRGNKQFYIHICEATILDKTVETN